MPGPYSNSSCAPSANPLALVSILRAQRGELDGPLNGIQEVTGPISDLLPTPTSSGGKAPPAGVARSVASVAANAGTPGQVSGFSETERDEPVGSELLRISGEMAVGGGIEPPTSQDGEITKPASVRGSVATAKPFVPSV